jgi:hypothetical protein
MNAQLNITDWERVKREAATNAPVHDQTGLYDPNDTAAVNAYWKAAAIAQERSNTPI